MSQTWEKSRVLASATRQRHAPRVQHFANFCIWIILKIPINLKLLDKLLQLFNNYDYKRRENKPKYRVLWYGNTFNTETWK